MRLWRCEYTGELIAGSKDRGGFPLFGGWLPFLGFKRIPCDKDGSFADDWPPRFVSIKIGVMWLGHGFFYTPPWAVAVKEVNSN